MEDETNKQILDELKHIRMLILKECIDLKHLLTKIEKNTSPIMIPADSGLASLGGKLH